MATPFIINIPDEELNCIKEKVRSFPWQAMPALEGWDYGANLDYMKEICDYWVNNYDWRKYETK